MLGLSSEKTESPKGLLSNLLSIKADGKNDKFSLLLKSFSFGKNDGNDVLKDLDLGVLDTKSLKGLKLGVLEGKGSKGLEKLDAFLQTDTKELPKELLKGLEKSENKKESPLSKLFALGNEESSEEELIHTDILKSLPTKDFKQNLQQLIGEAKSYLKEKIREKIDIKELPKTLGGLIKLAEKSGIDVRAIDFESLPQTPLKEKLAPSIALAKPTPLAQANIPHSTSQLVKPDVVTKKEQAPAQKPLDALLNKDTKRVFDEVTKTDEAPKSSKPFNTALNALLHGEKSEATAVSETSESTSVKIEGDKGSEKSQLVQQGKNEQLSAKITEAKQLVQHVAQSMKEAVENYKPPFTRIKMQLNPQKFGEMDVTLVQRGNNVHININASTSALTLMMQNSHELRAQLSSQGLGDASMNFSSHQQHQGEKHKQEHAGLTYEEYQEYEEEFNEIATTLEVIVPRYI